MDVEVGEQDEEREGISCEVGLVKTKIRYRRLQTCFLETSKSGISLNLDCQRQHLTGTSPLHPFREGAVDIKGVHTVNNAPHKLEL